KNCIVTSGVTRLLPTSHDTVLNLFSVKAPFKIMDSPEAPFKIMDSPEAPFILWTVPRHPLKLWTVPRHPILKWGPLDCP
ncbi:unnamed protein product, partial [Staurois parvus]